MPDILRPRQLMRVLPLFAALLALLLPACAAYRPEPLALAPDLAPDLAHLKPPAAPVGEALSLTEVAVLAVRNNPDLKARRRELGIKRAQLFAAGLLPDPQLSASLDHPTEPATVNGFALGLDYDLGLLINRKARKESAREDVRRVNLEVMWQEWQVSQRARSLGVRLVGENRQLAILHEMGDLYRQRYRQAEKAVARGDLTLDVAGTDLTALLDTLSRIGHLEQSRNDTRHELNLLLGLGAEAILTVSLPPPPVSPDRQRLAAELATLPGRRPDLLALQAGYRSQEAKVRGAILAQFPSISLGVNRARDTSDVYTTGLSVGLTLPLFSGNRGAIAVERATRARLREEYQARLDQAAAGVDRLLGLQDILAAQEKQLEEYLPTMKQLVDQGRGAYRRGDIDALTFLNMENTWVDKRLEQIDLEQARRTNLIALQTLLALPEKGVEATPATKGDGP